MHIFIIFLYAYCCIWHFPLRVFTWCFMVQYSSVGCLQFPWSMHNFPLVPALKPEVVLLVLGSGWSWLKVALFSILMVSGTVSSRRSQNQMNSAMVWFMGSNLEGSSPSPKNQASQTPSNPGVHRREACIRHWLEGTQLTVRCILDTPDMNSGDFISQGLQRNRIIKRFCVCRALMGKTWI